MPEKVVPPHSSPGVPSPVPRKIKMIGPMRCGQANSAAAHHAGCACDLLALCGAICTVAMCPFAGARESFGGRGGRTASLFDAAATGSSVMSTSGLFLRTGGTAT